MKKREVTILNLYLWTIFILSIIAWSLWQALKDKNKGRLIKLKDKKTKGPDAVKRPDPQRKAEAKRFVHSKGLGLESPQGKIFLEFMKIYPLADVTLNACEMLWYFLTWLKSKGIHLIDERTVYCMPFSHLVRYKGLK